jgi:dihydrofolate reductase
MGKLIVWNVASLDGYFEGPEPWDLSLHETIWGDELAALSDAQLADTEALVFGRRTYEGMAAHWTSGAESGPIADAMNALPKIVVSNTLTDPKWNNTTLVSSDAVEALRKIKAKSERNLYVYGSAELLSSLLSAGLVDEYRLGIAPLLLGRGNPLFKRSDLRIDLELIKTQPLKNGGVVLYYRLGSPT